MKPKPLSILFPLFLGLALVLAWLLALPPTTRAAPVACVPGPHSGHITADEEWCLADSPHLVEGNVIIDPGVTLTVEPGVIVRVPGWPWHIALNVQGNLEAVGTPNQPITFTSTTGGSTWAGLIVDGGSANLQYATVEYACSTQNNITVRNDGALMLDHSAVQHCHYGGGAGEILLRIDDSTATIRHSTFTASDWYPIYLSFAQINGNMLLGKDSGQSCL